MTEETVVYFEDELKDDFNTKKINTIKIDGSYKYIHKSILWNILSFVIYRILATPFAYLYMKIKFNLKFENREVLKQVKNTGYFLYINHTQEIGDALMPALMNFPRKTYVVVHPDNVSLPFWGNIIKFLGPLPIPGDIESGKNFINAIEKLISKKKAIVIYPEAHVWEYFTKIRPYGSTSFKYPVSLNVPAFAVTVTYRKRKNKRPRIVTYIDGPFYPDNHMSSKEKKEDLRNKIYNAMVKRAETNDVQYIKYLKKGESDT